jgi:hypothetical protein
METPKENNSATENRLLEHLLFSVQVQNTLSKCQEGWKECVYCVLPIYHKFMVYDLEHKYTYLNYVILKNRSPRRKFLCKLPVLNENLSETKIYAAPVDSATDLSNFTASNQRM